jgi:hypothetical protein
LNATRQAPSSMKEAAPLNEFERKREERLAANQKRLEELNLPSLASKVAAPAKPKAPKKRKHDISTQLERKDADAPPPRKSGRLAGVAIPEVRPSETPRGERNTTDSHANGGSSCPPFSHLLTPSLSQELAAGVLDESRAGVRTAAGLHVVTGDIDNKIKRADGPQPFRSANGSESSDAVFLSTLRAASCAFPGPSPAATTALLSTRLELSEDSVAKVTPKGISHLDWAPRSDVLLLAAGDKQGCVSLFNLSAAASASPAVVDEDDDDGAADGVLVLRPHSEYISGLRWARQGATRLHTVSYDGSVRTLDAESATWLQCHASDIEWSAFEPALDGGSGWLGDNEGGIRLLDFRSGLLGSAIAAHGRKVNTLSLRGDMLASSSGDNTVRVWDARKLGGGGKAQCLAELVHGAGWRAAAAIHLLR